MKLGSTVWMTTQQMEAQTAYSSKESQCCYQSTRMEKVKPWSVSYKGSDLARAKRVKYTVTGK